VKPDAGDEQVRRRGRADRDAANARRRWIIDLPCGGQRVLTWSDIPEEHRDAPFGSVWQLAKELGSDSAYEWG
jgi:hypothetical protein